MRMIARFSLVLLVLGLTAGPVLAAGPFVASSPALHAPTTGVHPLLATLLHVLSAAGVVFGITIKKDIGSIAQKFVTRAQAAAGDYKTGVSNAGSTWEANTGAAESNYDQGVQAAIASKRFAKGVTGKAGKYQTNAVNLGSQRYGPGVANAQGAYAAGMQPVLSTLSGLNLPAKSFRGSPANMQRANAVAMALAALRANK